MLIFLYAPIIILIVFSFNESVSSAKFTGFTFDWYVELFQDRIIMKALYNTLVIAVLSSFFATIIGTAAAIGIQAMKKNTKKVVLALNNIPVVNPDIVTGISLMILYLFVFNLFKAGSTGFATLLLAHITFNIPYVILSVLPKVRQVDKSLFEAALDLGAKPFYAFYKIILPQLLPAIITGAIFAFTLSLDDFVVSFFTKGAGVSNLSIVIYSSAAKKGINPKINALTTIMFLSIMLLLILINIRDKKELKLKKKKV